MMMAERHLVKTMTEQKEYFLHITDPPEEREVRYAELPPPPQDRFVLHVWVDAEYEITKTWKRPDEHGRLRWVIPRGERWECYDDTPKDHTVWRRTRYARPWRQRFAP